MFDLKTEVLFDIRFSVAHPSEFIYVGNGGSGFRGIAPITGGTFQGPELSGTVKPFGADWFMVRKDNTFTIDVRILLATDDGAVIHMAYTGLMTADSHTVEKMLQGEYPPSAQCLITPRFDTGHQKYQWLNKEIAVGTGRVYFDENDPHVAYSIYALR